MPVPVNLDKVQPQCRELVSVIEGLLEKRQDEANKRHTGEKWNRTRLDEQYPPYKDIRLGKVKYPPPREELLRLGDILHCSKEEKNLLLVATKYAILETYLEGEALERALLLAQPILDYLNIPSMVITRDFNIQRWNKSLPRLFRLNEQEFKAENEEERNVLRYVFDDRTPVHKLLYKNMVQGNYIASMGIFWFKSDNINCRHEKWYQAKSDSLMKYPGFREMWDAVDLDYKPSDEVGKQMTFPQFILEIFLPAGQTLRMRGLQIKYFDYDYPKIVSFMPENKVTSLAFKALELPFVGKLLEDSNE
jgi:hypothetical protein